MSRSNSLIGSVIAPIAVIAALLVGWEMSKPRHPRVDESFAMPATSSQRPPPDNPNERIAQDNRKSARRNALAALERPWASLCRDEGKKNLVSSLAYYFNMRRIQERIYPEQWGEVGRSYIAREFSTTDDQRVDRLTADLYRLGYIDLKAFDVHTNRNLAPVLAGVRVIAQPCNV